MKLGQLQAAQDDGQRDAVHVPIVVVTSENLIQPGQPVRFTGSSFDTVRHVKESEAPHALADPFLKKAALPGQYFCVLLMPEAMGKLTHHYDILIDDFQGDEDDGCSGCY